MGKQKNLPHILFINLLDLEMGEVKTSVGGYHLQNAKALKHMEAGEHEKASEVSCRIIDKISAFLDDDDFSEKEIADARAEALTEFNKQLSGNSEREEEQEQEEDVEEQEGEEEEEGKGKWVGYVLGGLALVGTLFWAFSGNNRKAK